MNKIVVWSLIASLAGFLFGFDTVVISGADKKLQELWNSSDAFHGTVVMGMALWGTVFGAIFGGIPANKIGRKNTLIWIGVLFFFSAIGSALANDPIVFAIFRFVGGLGVGASTIAAPAYISEIAPAKDRGKLVAFYQFNIVLGILIAFLSNYLLRNAGENSWRWMMGVQAIPSLIYTLFIFTIPKSPRWLLSKSRNEEAKKVLASMGQLADFEAIKREIEHDNTSAVTNDTIFSKKYRTPLLLAFLIAFFNQLSGINFLLYYAPRILEEAGFAKDNSLLSSISIGLMNLIFTFVGLWLIDRIGRKTLLIIGSFGYIISLSMVAYGFFMHSAPTFMLVFLLLFIAAHAIGQGAVIWVFISEIFPTQVRAAGQSFGASIHWIFAAVITLVTPVFLDSEYGIFKDNPWPIFAFFAGMMALQLVWILVKVPETKGVSLEELQKKLVQ